MDFMNQVFVYDEYSDKAHEDKVQVMYNTMMDALRNPHTPRPKGEWVGGEVTRQYVTKKWDHAHQLTLDPIKVLGARNQDSQSPVTDTFHQGIQCLRSGCGSASCGSGFQTPTER